MGRLSRHKKIKSCDPFFKGQKDVDLRYVPSNLVPFFKIVSKLLKSWILSFSSNAPVQASQLDSQPVPRKAKDLFKDGKKIKFKGKSRQSLNSKAVVKRKRNKEQKYIRFLAFLSICCKLRYHTYLGSESGRCLSFALRVHKNYFFTIYSFQFFLVK